MTKRPLLSLLALLFLAVGTVGVLLFVAMRPSEEKLGFDRVQVGMKEAEIVRLFGRRWDRRLLVVEAGGRYNPDFTVDGMTENVFGDPAIRPGECYVLVWSDSTNNFLIHIDVPSKKALRRDYTHTPKDITHIIGRVFHLQF